MRSFPSQSEQIEPLVPVPIQNAFANRNAASTFLGNSAGHSRAPVAFHPCGVQPLRERLTRSGILILAQPQEIIGSDFPAQFEPFRSNTNPFAGNALAFIVVITDAEMFLKVLLCVFEIVLRLLRDHGEHSVTAVGQRSVSATQTLIDPALGATLAAVLVEGTSLRLAPHPAFN